MEYPPLVTKAELEAAYPTAGPVSQPDLDALQDDVRSVCGWHIAPKLVETVTLRSEGETALVLPTLKLHAVLSVERWTGTTWEPMTGAEDVDNWSARSCCIYRASGFPRGTIRVTMEHGYETLPPALLQGLQRLLSGRPGPGAVAAEGLPGHTLTLDTSGPFHATLASFVSSGSLSRFKLGPRP